MNRRAIGLLPAMANRKASGDSSGTLRQTSARPARPTLNSASLRRQWPRSLIPHWSNPTMPALFERVRPHCWADYIMSETTAKQVERLRISINRPDFSGDAFLIHGPSGTGKSTLAGLIARELCCPFAIDVENGRRMDLDRVRDLARELWMG